MKQFIRDYFTFNKRERNGLFVLLSIITSLVVYLNISYKFNKPETVDFTRFEKEIDTFNTSVQKVTNSAEQEQTRVYKTTSANDNAGVKQSERFIFDPNNLPEKDWKRLGLSDKQIQTIKNYESKGGKFHSKEDVKKMYCIKADFYSTLEPYIQISSSSSKESGSEVKTTALFKNGKVENESELKPRKVESLIVVELNSADSATLTTIKGIGPFYAKNIIKYRNSIGGFIAKEQLLEIWKFDQEKLNSIEKLIDIDPSKIKKVNINACEAAELKSAYIKWNVANAIVNYRNNHGKYKTVDEIKKTDLVDDETYRKIAPYLILD
jgi:DNA uptake protein ComE-like DNA-binding protein